MKKMKSCICASCEKNYEVEAWRKKSTYCSLSCKNSKASTWLLKTSFIICKATEEEKLDRLKRNFEKLVIRKEGCWDWSGKTHRGYPVMTCRKSLGDNKGHRVSWIIHVGKIPENMCILHKCDNPICTNPEHLFLGSNIDNVNDMLSKGRNPHGSKVGNSKLKEDQIFKIRDMLNKGFTLKYISEMFGVTRQAICLIKKNVNWDRVK